MHIPALLSSSLVLCIPAVLAGNCANCHTAPTHTTTHVVARNTPPPLPTTFDPAYTPVLAHTLAYNAAEARGRLTNAQRLARKLPLLRPTALAPRPPPVPVHAHPDLRTSRVQNARLAPRQSPTPCRLSAATGMLRAAPSFPNPTNGRRGFVSRVANAFGQYELAPIFDRADALVVVLKRCEADSAPFEIEALNGLKDFPLLGGIVGMSSSNGSFGQGSSNHAYLGGVVSVPQGPAHEAPNSFSTTTGVQRSVESVLWTLGPDGATLNAAWVNDDGAPAVGVSIVNVPGQQAIALTSDIDAFAKAFGPAFELPLQFVPLLPS
ncbi:hypothetical protein C8Q77DRAFT_1149276 [Trametes polyzona]|nr:hypothetical protein C8Q77DRAFT_1149276 [Trametes polyzona]